MTNALNTTRRFIEIPATCVITPQGTSFAMADMRAEDRGGFVGAGSMFIPNPNYVKECPFEACPGGHDWDEDCDLCCDGQYADWYQWNEDAECDRQAAEAGEDD